MFQPALGALVFGSALVGLLRLNRGERRLKRLLYLGAWYCVALATLAKGAPGLVLPLAVIGAVLCVRRQWLEQPPKYERQRLEPVDRPFEIEHLLESFLRHLGPQRPRILATREALPGCPAHAQSCSHTVNRQCRQLAQRADTPATERDQ